MAAKSAGFILFLLLICSVSFSQNIYIRNFSKNDFNEVNSAIGPQNWAAIQDSLGRIWIANTSTVMLYDGVNWSSVSGTENKVIRKFVRGKNNIIYAGGRNDIGYFTFNESGQSVYQSLRSLVPDTIQNIGEIRAIAVHEEAVFFKSKEYLIKYDEDSIMLMPFTSEHVSLSSVKNGIIIQNENYDFILIRKNNIDTLLTGNNGYHQELVEIFDLSDNNYLVFTENSGIYKLSNHRLFKLSSAIEEIIDESPIEEVRMTDDDNGYVLATRGAGIFILDNSLNVIKQITTRDGLQSNTSYALYNDKQRGWWVCLDNGVSRIEYPAALSYYDVTNELDGIVLTTLTASEFLYVGTTNGLFYKKSGEGQNFSRIGNIEEVWDLKRIGENIWVASSNGIFLIRNNSAFNVADVSARSVASSYNPDRLWVGLEKGFGWIIWSGKDWIWTHSDINIEHQVRTIAQENDSILWVSDDRISKLTFDEKLNRIIDVKTLDEKQGLTDDFWIIESYFIQDRILFGTPLGLYTYDQGIDMIRPDTVFGHIFSEGERDAYALAEDDKGQIWLTSDRAAGPIYKNDQGSYAWDTLALTRLKKTDIWRIVPDKNGIVWFCTTDGLYKYDLNVETPPYSGFSTLINRVDLNGDSLAFHNSRLTHRRKNEVDLPDLDFEFNSIRFAFSSTSYNVGENIQYSHKLEGYDKQWSDWVNESVKEYTELSPGTYRFLVRSKNLYTVSPQEADFSFIILPPWYRTWWAYSIFGLVFIGMVAVADRIQRRRLYLRQQATIRMQERELERERDISRKLRKVDKLKDEFLAHTSHELRTPLNGIIGISESLHDQFGKLDSAFVKKNLSMVISSGKRLSNMVNSILDYSKLKSEDLELKIKNIDLKSLVDIVLAMSEPLIASSKVSLINDVPEDLNLVSADENRLQQILFNLIGNAIKFTEEGSITVSAKIIDGKAQITVKDTGIGIPENKKEHIFESYEQVGHDIDREFIGTGLGLTITKNLVELHGGKIWVESKQNEGSTFYFTLPVSDRKADIIFSGKMEKGSIPEKETALNEMPDKGNFKILIVDDEPVNRQVLVNHLREEDYQLSLAANGREALDLVDQIKFDIILLDVMMPGMSGYEVCRQIRKKYTLNELPVIFITAKDQIKDLVEGLNYGGNDYITKPISKQEFLARIKTHLKLLKINDSYSRFIPYEFIQSLGRESIIEVNLGDQIEKEVTIMFADIRDYTTLAERMTPVENFTFLNSFLSKIGPIIRQHQGFIMHYLGDGLMALFPDDADNAIQASIEIQKELKKFNKTSVSKLHESIQVGIGLHTGTLILGILGDDQRMDANVVSDAVNTASRMEGLTKHYGALSVMSDNTLSKVSAPEKINYRFLGLVRVKGKSRPIKIYELLDGVESESNRLKIELKETFEKGLDHYFKKDFVMAASVFKEITLKNPDDMGASKYLKICARLIVDGVNDTWDGVDSILV